MEDNGMLSIDNNVSEGNFSDYSGLLGTPPPDFSSQGEYQEGQFEQQPEQPEQPPEPDYWTMPDGLSERDQVDWYKERMEQLTNYVSGGEFQTQAEQQRQQMLDEVAREIEDFKTVYQALKTNPKDYLMQYFPDLLVQWGISPVLSVEEIGSKVHEQLEAQFGADYQQRVNPNEMFNPTSFTAMVYQQQQQLYNHFSQMNERNREMAETWGERVANGEINTQQMQQQPEVSVETLVEQYEQNFSSRMTPEEFAEFVDAASSHQMTMDDAYKVVHFDDYVNAAYMRGVEEGRKAFYKQVNNTGNATRQYVQPQQERSRLIETDDVVELRREMANFSNGGMPYY